MEFSKADNKIARIIIKIGLMKEFEKGLNHADHILKDWKERKDDARASYHALYTHITDFDKGIARRYDGMKNSDLLYIVIQQLNEALITQEDLADFSEDGKSIIQRILSLRER